MMESDDQVDLCGFIRKGGVHFNIKGSRTEEIYRNMVAQTELPEGISRDTFLTELCQREELMSTAVGNGIALPHPRSPILKDPGEQRIVVYYLDKPAMLNPPDSRPIYVLFMLLTANTQTHLKILSQLAFLFQKPDFRAILEKKPAMEELLAAVRKFQ